MCWRTCQKCPNLSLSHARSCFTCHPVPSAPAVTLILRNVWLVRQNLDICLLSFFFFFSLLWPKLCNRLPHLPAPTPSPPWASLHPSLRLPLAYTIPPEVNAGMLPTVVSPSPRVNNMATAAYGDGRWHGAARLTPAIPQHRRSSRASVILAPEQGTLYHWESLPISLEGLWCTNVKGTAMPAPAADATASPLALFGVMEASHAWKMMTDMRVKQKRDVDITLTALW